MRGGAGSLRLGLLLAGALALAAAASFWTGTPAIDVAARFRPSSAAHPLGTDQLGRDVAAMLAGGAWSSLAVAVAGVGAALAAGVPLGLLAAARPGLVDELAMRGGDTLFAFPTLMMAVLLAAALGPGTGTAILAVALFNLPVIARVTRGAARPLWARPFVDAARRAGKRDARIAAEHVLPNAAGPILVQASAQMALALIVEAGLSYVGLGVQPPRPSWGRMLADAQTLVGVAPRLAVLPGLAVALAALAFTLIGDGLRQRLAGGAAAG